MSPGCEPLADGLLTEPVAAVTSLAFVAAAAAIPIVVRRGRPVGAEDQPGVTGYALLVGAVGVGSVIQHGPDPPWSDLAHDTPLLATLVFVAADAVADLTGRRRAWWWWAAPTAAILPLVLAAPRAGDLAQAGLAAVAIGLTLARARARPALRRRVVGALALLAVGGTIGTLSRRGGPLCVPESIWQGHAAWHVLASVALVVLAPVIGRRGTAGRLGEVPRRLP
jgi:hypothetical protein